MSLSRPALLALTLALGGCGGGAIPGPAAPVPGAPAAPIAQPAATAQPAPPTVSVVRFDDLGVSFAVPEGFHVVGDDELAARIRATANPRLTASLQSRAGQKKGLPLLTLSKDGGSAGALTVTLTASVVPADAKPGEIFEQQKGLMADNLEAFALTDGPRERAQDGVPGVELSSRYGVRGAGETRKMASAMRIHVRAGLAFVIAAVWSAAAAREEEAKGLLDGVRFYEPSR